MSETTIIVSNLQKEDFVAPPESPLSLSNRIKLAILNLTPPDGEPQYAHNILHYSELPFLSRIIIIFKSAASASQVHSYLAAHHEPEGEESKKTPSGSFSFVLPASVKLSLQENLLLRSRLSENLEEQNELSVREDLERFQTKHNAGEYHEPEPEKVNMYQDLLKSGIDISKYNTEAEVKQFETGEKSGLGRSRSVTKTLFKPTPLLLVSTSEKKSGSIPPPSPTITLDETF